MKTTSRCSLWYIHHKYRVSWQACKNGLQNGPPECDPSAEPQVFRPDKLRCLHNSPHAGDLC
jgi:hypothetical protein